MTENELLARIRSGDENAFLEIYNSWQNTIFRFAMQMTGSKSMAEDITQEVFLLLIRKNVKFDPGKGTFSSFLYGIARNFSLRALRKNFRYHSVLPIFKNQQHEEPVAENNPLTELSDNETTANLRRCILSLPPRYREVIVLCDLHELTYAEAAGAIKTEIGTIRSRLHRGREILAQKLRWSARPQRENQGGNHYELPALQK
jgi:RNA polymerase sigma-70 factor (ECF subfamily)